MKRNIIVIIITIMIYLKLRRVPEGEALDAVDVLRVYVYYSF